jgi:hypothetical protein
MFRKHAGRPGELKHVPDKSKRPPVEAYLALQRRFEHLVKMSGGVPERVPGKDHELATIQAYADANVERLARWAAFDAATSAPPAAP